MDQKYWDWTRGGRKFMGDPSKKILGIPGFAVNGVAGKR